MNIYEQITNKILNRIEEAEKSGKPFHWVKPWNGGSKMPVSYATGHNYNGINMVMLEPSEYITYKALLDYKKNLSEDEAEKIQIKKGSHKVPIYYFGQCELKDKDGNVVYKDEDKTEPEKRWYMKYYLAYDREDISNLPSHFPAEKIEHTPIENGDQLNKYINAYAKAEDLEIDYVEDGSRCYYSPMKHMVRVPKSEGFVSLYSFFSAVLHEIVHSTSKGLNRQVGDRFGSTTYSKEEMVAQIGSQMLLNHFGIVPEKEDEEDNDIAYIKGWASYIKKSPKTEIVKASCLAQNAVEYFIETAERQFIKDRFLGMQEIALKYKDGYLFIQEGSDDYFDFTIFNNEKIAIDGGQIDISEKIDNIGQAVKDILNDMGVNINEVSLYEEIDNLMEISR